MHTHTHPFDVIRAENLTGKLLDSDQAGDLAVSLEHAGIDPTAIIDRDERVAPELRHYCEPTAECELLHGLREQLIAEMDRVQRRAKTRTCSSRDVSSAIRLFLQARRVRARLEAQGKTDYEIDVEVDGGGVPNSYRYVAETTIIAITEDADGNFDAQVYRGRARSASWGQVDTDRAWVIPPGKRRHSVYRVG
jgi:hypothetical protein